MGCPATIAPRAEMFRVQTAVTTGAPHRINALMGDARPRIPIGFALFFGVHP